MGPAFLFDPVNPYSGVASMRLCKIGLVIDVNFEMGWLMAE